jgi:WD40 repeat protein
MKAEAWVLDNPYSLGLLTAFVVDPWKNWLVTGTSTGYYTCWDMRFYIPLKTWGLPNRERIHKLINYRASTSSSSAAAGKGLSLSSIGGNSASSWIFSTSGFKNEVFVWDIETSTCKHFFRVLSSDNSSSSSSRTSGSSGVTEAPSSLNALPSFKPLDAPGSMNYGIEELQKPAIIHSNGIKALLNPADCSYLLTGGDDKHIRYWHLQNAVNSYTVTAAHGHYAPTYTSNIQDNVVVHQEIPSLGHHHHHRGQHQHHTHGQSRGPEAPSVSHRESILDLKAMELPHRMLISAARDGVIKVWK